MICRGLLGMWRKRSMTNMTTRLPFGRAAKNQVYVSYKCRAEKYGRCFKLTFDEFIDMVALPCFYCGAVNSNLKVNKSGSGDFAHNGIDRVNSNMGYFKKNCVPCCKHCNAAKSAMSQKKFLELVERIHEHQKRIL